MFDLRARLGLPAKVVEVWESLVIVRREGHPLAFRVDRPLELATFQSDDIESAGLGSGRANKGLGMAKLPEGLAVLLDLDTLLTPGWAGPLGEDRP